MTLRECLLHEAASWVGTPYHILQARKGVGADCMGWMIKTLEACLGLAIDYPPRRGVLPCFGAWFLHTTVEVLYDYCRALAVLVEVPRAAAQPADLLLMQWGGRPLHHTAMLLEGGLLQQATQGYGVHVARVEPYLAHWGATFRLRALEEPC